MSKHLTHSSLDASHRPPLPSFVDRHSPALQQVQQQQSGEGPFSGVWWGPPTVSFSTTDAVLLTSPHRRPPPAHTATSTPSSSLLTPSPSLSSHGQHNALLQTTDAFLLTIQAVLLSISSPSPSFSSHSHTVLLELCNFVSVSALQQADQDLFQMHPPIRHPINNYFK